MADKDPKWGEGDSQLLYSPTTGIDTKWSFGDSWIFDDYLVTTTDLSIHVSECVGSGAQMV